MRARWFDSQTGSFTTRDLAFGQTDQAYAYAGGDPVNGSDPSGLCVKVLWACVGGGPQTSSVGFHFNPVAGLKGAANFGASFVNAGVKTAVASSIALNPALLPFESTLLNGAPQLQTFGGDCGLLGISSGLGVAGFGLATGAAGGVFGGSEAADAVVVNLGGEGEVPGAINQQPPNSLLPGWGASRIEVGGKPLVELRSLGQPYVVAENTALPFPNASIDQVITNSVPIDVNMTMGPGVQSSEVWRVLKPAGTWLNNGQLVPRPW